MKSLKYRLYPKKSQQTKLKQQLEICRQLYNKFIEESKISWENNKTRLSLYDLQNSIVIKKQQNQNLKSVHSQILQNVAMRVDLAFQAFFRRCKQRKNPGYPRFKSIGQYRSITLPQYNNSVKIIDNKIYIPKIGWIKINLSRELVGIPKTATISVNSLNEWYITISCCDKDVIYKQTQSNLVVGVDLGITTFATCSDNTIIENPRFFEQNQKKLCKQQQKLQKAKGSNNNKQSDKLKIRIAKIHKKIKNRREDFAHKLSKCFVLTYKIICIEDIDINKMIKKNWMNKQIYDAAWNSFIQKLLYKAENAGVKVVKVNPAYTSQDCSKCHNRSLLKLSDREYSCEKCRLQLSRDLNASINIKTLGLQSLA